MATTVEFEGQRWIDPPKTTLCPVCRQNERAYGQQTCAQCWKDVCDAQEMFTLDELETYAAQLGGDLSTFKHQTGE